MRSERQLIQAPLLTPSTKAPVRWTGAFVMRGASAQRIRAGRPRASAESSCQPRRHLRCHLPTRTRPVSCATILP